MDPSEEAPPPQPPSGDLPPGLAAPEVPLEDEVPPPEDPPQNVPSPKCEAPPEKSPPPPPPTAPGPSTSSEDTPSKKVSPEKSPMSYGPGGVSSYPASYGERSRHNSIDYGAPSTSTQGPYAVEEKPSEFIQLTPVSKSYAEASEVIHAAASPMIMTNFAPPPTPQSAVEEATAEVVDEMQNASILSNHSNSSVASLGSGGEDGGKKKPTVILDQERFLPIANVVRIMKRQMDPQAKLAKDAKECVQECVSEFITFIASEAAEICNHARRKTISADDLLTAMEATGFDNFAEPMRIFLQKYRQAHKITGPLHRQHQNYTRPVQFESDPPVPPLFFDSANGRRGTETQYLINGHEVIRNAPFSEEWNEQTGQLRSVEQEQEVERRQIQQQQERERQQRYAETHLERVDDMVVDEEEEEMGAMGAIALEQRGAIQIYIDPKSKQHYAAKETPNGMELYPVIIQNTPLQLENVTGPGTFVMDMPDGEEVMLQSGVTISHDPNQPSTSGPPPPKRGKAAAQRYRQLDDDDEDEEDDDEEVPTSQQHRPPPPQKVPPPRMPARRPVPPRPVPPHREIPKRSPAKRKK